MHSQERLTIFQLLKLWRRRQSTLQILTFTALFVVYGVGVYVLASTFANAQEVERGYHVLSVLSVTAGWVALAAICFRWRSE